MTEADRELRRLLSAIGVEVYRKRRLFACAIARSVLSVLHDGPIRDIVKASAEHGEWWSDAEAEEETLDERTRLLRAYDRRQLRNPIVETLQTLRHYYGMAGSSYSPNSTEEWALCVAQAPLWDVSSLATGFLLHQCIDNARFALIRHKRRTLLSDKRTATADLDSVIRLQQALASDIFGNPFRPVKFDPAWRTSTAVALARGMYESRDFGAMPILADALQDAGCDNEDVLNHCRSANQVHVRGCWVVDLVLGKV